MKKTFIALTLAVLLLGTFLIWRALHPPLSDREQIGANIEAIASAADHRSASGIGYYLANDFNFNGTKKSELQKQLTLGILRYRVIDMEVQDVEIEVNSADETAKSEGRYTLSLKSEYNSVPETLPGDFELEWRKDDGEWKVSKAIGSPLQR